jgi:type II secretory pathway predicted ATPase ExeA
MGTYGMGKSSIARRLVHTLRAQPDKFFLIYNPDSSYDTEYTMLMDFVNACGCPRKKGIPQQWRELEMFLVEKRKENKNVVIILDDAQKIKPAALSAIHHLYNFDESAKIVQVVLVGQPELQNVIMKRPEVHNRVYNWLTLNPLLATEAFELIEYRRTVAGRTQPFLNPDQFTRVWATAGGIPRNLVILCSKIVDEVAAKNGRSVDDDAVSAAIKTVNFTEPRMVMLPGIE